MCSAACVMYGSTIIYRHLFNDLTAQVAGDVGDMNPTSIALKDELGKLDTPLPVHLHDEIKKCFIGFYVMGF